MSGKEVALCSDTAVSKPPGPLGNEGARRSVRRDHGVDFDAALGAQAAEVVSGAGGGG